MNTLEAIEARHSVRSFTDQKIESAVKEELTSKINQINSESKLHLQLFTDEPEAFSGNKPHYGDFRNCRNYLALVGPNDMDEQIGYYGEEFVLFAQTLGLNSCWVALTYHKNKVNCIIEKGEKLYIVIALGYGQTQGNPHKSKPLSELCKVTGTMPDWFKAGMEAALLAPTAMNQQKFMITLNNDQVSYKAGLGFYSKIDLGIVKYHFELGSGKKID